MPNKVRSCQRRKQSSLSRSACVGPHVELVCRRIGSIIYCIVQANSTFFWDVTAAHSKAVNLSVCLKRQQHPPLNVFGPFHQRQKLLNISSSLVIMGKLRRKCNEYSVRVSNEYSRQGTSIEYSIRNRECCVQPLTGTDTRLWGTLICHSANRCWLWGGHVLACWLKSPANEKKLKAWLWKTCTI